MGKIYLPEIKKENNSVVPAGETFEDELFRLIHDSSYQERDRELMKRHHLLDLAASLKARDLAIKNYFSHTSPEGVTANENVRSVGYSLPDYYPVKGNNVESLFVIASAIVEPELVVKAWYESDHHRAHVFGTNNFFRQQNCIGVGIAKPSSGKPTYAVFISAICP